MNSRVMRDSCWQIVNLDGAFLSSLKLPHFGRRFFHLYSGSNELQNYANLGTQKGQILVVCF